MPVKAGLLGNIFSVQRLTGKVSLDLQVLKTGKGSIHRGLSQEVDLN